MKLIDELQQIERGNALAGGAWVATLEKLSALMRNRAIGKGWGALLVCVHSRQVEIMLHSWAVDEGLEVQEGNSSFGTRALWLVWGHRPTIFGGCDAEIMPDGVLILRDEKSLEFEP